MECTEPDSVSPCPGGVSPCPGGGQGMQQVEYSVRCDVVVRTRTAPGSPKNLRLLTFDQANQTQTRPSETRPVLSPVLVLLLLTLSRDIRRHSIRPFEFANCRRSAPLMRFRWLLRNCGGGSRPPGSAFPARYTRRHDNSEDDTKNHGRQHQ